MIDGRTIYSPLFSGVFWEEHDITLEDVDRIEVIDEVDRIVPTQIQRGVYGKVIWHF